MSLFERALACDTQRQPAFIADACGGDDELRRDVERLLLSDRLATDQQFLAASPLAPRFAPDGADLIGREVGAYRIDELVGEGGMGYVFRASRISDFEQTAAVKIVRSCRGDANLVRAFQNEVQLLAKVRQHPGIVGLLDAGMTTDGFAYLVMDYVPGLPLDAFCQQRQLTWRQRLELFLQVCEAVAFAHQQLVTHRDLKPSNILVVDGEAKLLDFGIAREESFANLATQTGVRAFTPAYASPEQVRGEPLNTLTDVYSLGVILYQLLTNRRPFDTAGLSPGELEQRICETEPPPLRPVLAGADGNSRGDRLRRETARELDAIVLKAMAKNPAQRYGTVAALADDIQRLLRGEPVRARKRTTVYVLTKFVRRHRVMVAAACALVAALAIGVIGTSVGLRRAERERLRAEASSTVARQTVADFLDVLDRERIGSLAGSQRSRLEFQKVLRVAAETLQRDLVRDDSIDRQLATIDLRVGQILRQLGDRSGAVEYLDRARRAYEALIERHPEEQPLRLELGNCWQNTSVVHLERLELPQAEAAIAKARQQFRTITAADLLDQADIGEAGCLSTLGRLAALDRDIPQATDNYEQAYELLDSLHKRRRDDAAVFEKLAAVINDLGAMRNMQGEAERAEAIARVALDELVQLADDEPNVVDYQVLLAKRLIQLANSLYLQGKAAEARTVCEQAIERWSRIAERNPDVLEYKSQLAAVLRNLGTMCLATGDIDAALENLARSAAIRESIVAAVRDQPTRQDELAKSYRTLGEVYDEAERFDEALAQFDKAESVHETMIRAYPDQAEFLGSYGLTLHVRGMALKHMGRNDEAILAYQRGIELVKQALSLSSGYANYRELLINLYFGSVGLYADAADAIQLEAALTAWEQLVKDDANELAAVGVQYAMCTHLEAADGTPLLPDAAERGRSLLQRAQQMGADLSELATFPSWPLLRELPGYAELIQAP